MGERKGNAPVVAYISCMTLLKFGFAGCIHANESFFSPLMRHYRTTAAAKWEKQKERGSECCCLIDPDHGVQLSASVVSFDAKHFSSLLFIPPDAFILRLRPQGCIMYCVGYVKTHRSQTLLAFLFFFFPSLSYSVSPYFSFSFFFFFLFHFFISMREGFRTGWSRGISQQSLDRIGCLQPHRDRQMTV